LCRGVVAMHTVVHCFLEAACIRAGLEASIAMQFRAWGRGSGRRGPGNGGGLFVGAGQSAARGRCAALMAAACSWPGGSHHVS
jgi:hypothetical protein